MNKMAGTKNGTTQLLTKEAIHKEEMMNHSAGNAVKLEQFQTMMTHIVRNALEENNQALSREVGGQVGDKVLKEMNYLMRVQEDAMGDAYLYLLILSAGLIGTIGYNINAGILQGLGDSRSSLSPLSMARRALRLIRSSSSTSACSLSRARAVSRSVSRRSRLTSVWAVAKVPRPGTV